MNDLNARRPTILGGCKEQTNRALGVYYTYDGCHAWVCDGYHQINDNINGYSYLFFHMNWGWHERFSSPGNPSLGGGDYNGWYQYNNWNISGLNRNYQYANDAIINIHP